MLECDGYHSKNNLKYLFYNELKKSQNDVLVTIIAHFVFLVVAFAMMTLTRPQCTQISSPKSV